MKKNQEVVEDLKARNKTEEKEDRMGENQMGKKAMAMKVREDNRGESTVTEDAWLGGVMHTCNPST